MPVKSGKQYIERINAQTVPCWYKGELVTGKRSEHLAFKGLMETQAQLYDMQSDPLLAGKMTYESPQTANRWDYHSCRPPQSMICGNAVKR